MSQFSGTISILVKFTFVKFGNTDNMSNMNTHRLFTPYDYKI